MLRFALLLPLVLCAGCRRLPEWYSPPAQRAALTPPSAVAFGHFVAMSDPGADAYIVQGFREKSEGPWRWAHDHPVLRFWLPPVERIRFAMDFALPDQNFRQTGPVTLTIRINGTEIDRVLCDRPGGQHYSREIAPGLLHLNGVNTVALDPDKSVRREGGERLGFVLTDAGFVE